MMKIENLSEGLIIKNYKELCSMLEIKVEAGNSKKAQLKELERFIKYHKEGNKFIIDEIYNENSIREKDDKRGICNNAYGEELKYLILCILATSEENNELIIPATLLLRQLCMINDNYSIGRKCQDRLSELMCMDEVYINEFYNTTHANLKSSVETALNQLRKMSLLEWKRIVMVCKKKANFKMNEVNEIIIGDDFKPLCTVKESYEPATKEEIMFILDAERLMLLDYGCDNISQIFKLGKATEYYKKVNEIVRKNTNIFYYFNAYDIVYNSNHIYDKLISLGVNAAELRRNINAKVQEKLMNNAINRNSKALDEYYSNDNIKKSKEVRIEDDYIEKMQLLITILIDTEAINITKKIKEIKV